MGLYWKTMLLGRVLRLGGTLGFPVAAGLRISFSNNGGVSKVKLVVFITLLLLALLTLSFTFVWSLEKHTFGGSWEEVAVYWSGRHRG